MFAAFFIACDDGIGRVDRLTLPQQTLMELFVFGLNEPEKICGSREDPDDVCEWKGVRCNADGEVEHFWWTNKDDDGTGTLGFEFLPCSMKALRMYLNALSGTIQLAELFGKLEVVYLYHNQLTGSLDLDRLPAAVRELDLSSNEFTGDISLEKLPKGLEVLALLDNQLSGTICLTSLPPALGSLYLGRNNFEGSLYFRRLPKSIRKMVLSENRFSGTIDLGNLPQSMRVLDVGKNAISGTIRVPYGIHIRLNGNDELTVERIE
ncbi:leucine-rich repeat protein [Perkinsela sp. CCAP 1560/4]|nr:leucine-rich repeat protein [Perkinsela sp. CCAP 1560/4]|eukprot:KNH06774.1 leucine-rich repeat protein [Perkinsela sp. CCAP 1560/4]